MSCPHQPGRSRPLAPQGFTLVEILVVMVIIGVLIAGAILSLGATGQDSQLERERDRLAALMAYVRERGSMLSLEYGIRCGVHGYRFAFYDNRLMQWSPESVDDTLRIRRLPSGLSLHLVIEGREIVLDDKALKVNPSATTTSAGSTLSTLSSTLSALANSSSGSTGSFGGSFGGNNGVGSGSLGSSSLGSGSLGSGGGADSGGGLNDTLTDNTPQIMLFSNGDTNAFALTIERESVGRSTTLQSSDDGTVRVGDIVEPKR